MSQGDKIEQYSSRIEEINDSSMVIAMPMSKGFPIILEPGAQFKGRIVINGAVFSFDSIFLDKRLEPFPVWIVSLPENIDKIQQRAFVRLSTKLPVSIVCLDNNQNGEEVEIPAWTRDISGGGMQLVVRKPLKVGSNLHLTFRLLPDDPQIEAVAKVIRIEHPQPDRDIYWVGVNFVVIAEKDRSRIIRYIFQKQIEYRRRGI